MTESKDVTLRAITNDGSFRLVAVRMTDTIAGVVASQSISGDVAHLFGRVAIGAVLIRETMAPSYRVQAVLRFPDGETMVGDSHPGGITRGLAGGLFDAHPGIDDGVIMQVSRVMPRGELHNGVVDGVGMKNLSDLFREYLIRSEQVESRIELGVLLDDDGNVTAAGGYLVQTLPEFTAETLAQLNKRLETLPPIDEFLRTTEGDPASYAAAIFADFEHTILATSPVRHGCTCSEVRVLGAIATTGKAEIRQLVESGEVVDIKCEYCGTAYQFGPEKLRSLLEES